MLILFYIIIFIEIITIFYNLIKFIIFKKNNNNFICNNNAKDNVYINILIPCYAETKVIKKTLEHFNNITQNIKNISIYVITTEKEKLDNSLKQTTYEYLKNINFSDIHIINYPKTQGIMADQLNYAINEILSNSKLPQNQIYFSIYNADSHPDVQTFHELIDKIFSNNFPFVIQQYSNYFLNYNQQNFIMRGFAMYQTAFEIRNGLINNNVSKSLYSHVVGHGLSIRADYIKKLNGFNNDVWCEDIYLTGLLYNNNIKIISLKSMDNAENPEKLLTQINQNAVWFKTASNPFYSLNDIKRNYKITKYGILWLIHELRATFVWIFMPIFLIFTFAYPLIIKNLKLLLISLIIYLVFVFVNYIANLIIINKNMFKAHIKDYFSTIFSILLTGIGPIKSFFLKEKIKTPH